MSEHDRLSIKLVMRNGASSNLCLFVGYKTKIMQNRSTQWTWREPPMLYHKISQLLLYHHSKNCLKKGAQEEHYNGSAVGKLKRKAVLPVQAGCSLAVEHEAGAAKGWQRRDRGQQAECNAVVRAVHVILQDGPLAMV